MFVVLRKLRSNEAIRGITVLQYHIDGLTVCDIQYHSIGITALT
jgi:hypothetical protein